MIKPVKYLGHWSLAVVIVTLILFIAALFFKGFTHDLLLETAIFLVSVKLIILSYQSNQGIEEINEKLDRILEKEQDLEDQLQDLGETSKE